MKARAVIAAVLLGLIAAVAAALYALHRAEQRDAAAAAPEPVVAATDAIERIEINTRQASLALGRTDAAEDAADEAAVPDRWQLTRPIAAPADPKAVATLLELATTVPARRYPRDEIAPAVTGLDDPPLVLRYNGDAPIAIGGPGPTPGSRYVRTAHALLIVSAPGLADLPADWPGWLAPTLVDADETLVSLTLPRLTLTLNSAQGDGAWAVTPAHADRGADLARATVAAWRQAEAREIRHADAGRARQARVTLRFADGNARHIDVIAREPELVLRDTGRGLDYHFAPALAAPLLDMQHPAALRAARRREGLDSAIELQPNEN